jgi:glycerophosphoryl diester phosphodiesterase
VHAAQAPLAACGDGTDDVSTHHPPTPGTTRSDRTATYTIDGQQRSGVFVADLTLAELRQLKARQPWPFRDHSHANRSVGVYPGERLLGRGVRGCWMSCVRTAAAARVSLRMPHACPCRAPKTEAKHPAWHNARQALRAANTTMEALIAAALHKRGYSASAPYGSERWRRQPALIQSFELSSLRRFAGLTPLPLVLLLGGWPGGVDPDTGLTLPQLTSERKLQELAAFVTVVAPGKADLFELQLANGTALPAAAAAAAAAAQQAAGSATLRSSGLAERVRCAGLLLHTNTLRDERRFVLPGCGGDVACEFKLLFERLHVDGAFADWPATLVRFLRQQQQ